MLTGAVMFAALATVQPIVFFGGGASFQQIHLDELHCSGAEATLLNCTHSGVGVHDCKHYEDVGIICKRSQGKTSCLLNLLMRRYYYCACYY